MICKCGHLKSQHIYEEGACRPGFGCPQKCEKYDCGSEMTRREQIISKADTFNNCNEGAAFIEGAEWADANPFDESQLIIDLIHQRSVAFDYGRQQSEMLKIAEDALELVCKQFPKDYVVRINEIAIEALAKLKEMRDGK